MPMRTLKLVLVMLLAGAARLPAQPAQAAPPSSGDVAIERLAGLAKVWGAVRLFHPYPAYRDIDWDRALVETIPKVRAATSPEEYRAAIAAMLAILDDDNTRAEIAGGATPDHGPDTAPTVHVTDPVRMEDGVLVIDAVAAVQAILAGGGAAQRIYAQITALSQQAAAIVLDCRPKLQLGAVETEFVGYYFGEFLRRMITSLAENPVRLGTSRYRLHNGWTPRYGGSSGGYYSAMVETAPETVPGSGRRAPPIAVIVDDRTPGGTRMIQGLRSGVNAVVVREGDGAGEIGVDSWRLRLPDDVAVRIRLTENVNPDGSIGLRVDASVPKSADDRAFREAVRLARDARSDRATELPGPVIMQRDARDEAYAQMEFPGPEYRLLALFRFWNVIEHFFPYRQLIGDSWETILHRYIPRFEANRSALEYQTTVREMVAEIHDTHAFVSGTTKFDETLGAYTHPVFLRHVEGRTVVEKVLDAGTDLRPGDVIVAMDGEPVERRREALAPLFAASTPHSLNRRLDAVLLLGERDSRARLTVRDAEGRQKDLVIVRSHSVSDPTLYAALERSTPVFQVLPSGFGYVDLTRLQLGEVDAMFETIASAPATIFDMRGYPNGTGWTIAPRLTDRRNVVAALFSRPILEANRRGDPDYADGTQYTFRQVLPEPEGSVYRGRVVMLINEDAISQAEHTALFFEAARPDITFIGSPTVGANGDITNLVLPGNLVVRFSGHSVQHADGRQLQRVGIQPTIRVEPTIRGIAAGRDEILEAAIAFLQRSPAM